MPTHPSMNPTTTSKTPTITSTSSVTSTVISSTPLYSDTKPASQRDLGLNESYIAPEATYEQVTQDADLFHKTLKNLHGSLGTKITVPTIGGKALDLYQLFVQVTSRGGLAKVIQNRQWKEIIAVFNFPVTITNASFVLRKYYMSLLHHYEQVYFRRENKPFSLTYVGNSPVGASSSLQTQCATNPENGTNTSDIPANSQICSGSRVSGTIDGKFDYGYLVTVTFGSEKLKGVLYHVPHDSHVSANNTNDTLLPRRRNRKRSRRADSDPSRPNPNRSGYNFFFSENYASLKSSHDDGQEKTISTKMGNMWSQLSEAEKQVYRDKSLRDKEKYREEMSKPSDGSQPQ